MKIIGVDAFPLTKTKGGVGTYIFFLLDELIRLQPDSLFYLYAPSREGDLQHFLQYPNVTLRIIPSFQFSHLLWKETALAFFLWKDKVDFFWGTTQTLPFFKRKKMKTCLSLYDFTYLIVPQSMTFLFRLYFKLMMPMILKRADLIFPISMGTAQKLKAFYQLDHHGVVYPPLKPAISLKNKAIVETRLKEQGLIDGQYIITVGTLEPRKNFNTLLQIYCTILEKYPLKEILPLVLVGGGGWKNHIIKQTLDEAKTLYPDHIKFLGHLDDEKLSYFLSGARYYLTLSHYEGYGMPLAEARVCGTPTICFDLPEMREAAENEGIFLKQDDLESQLIPIFVSKNSIEEKKSLMTRYPSNRQKAMILSNAIHKLK